MIKNRLNLIEIDSDIERPSVAAQLVEQIDEPMLATPPKDDCANYSNDTDVIQIIAESKIRALIAGEIDRLYAERTQTKLQAKIEKPFVDLLPIWQ